MKIRPVLVVLGLLMFIFCSVSLSQAAWDKRYNNIHFPFIPSEHPWQESGSPPFDDTIRPNVVSPVCIVVGPVKIIIIRPSRVKSVPNGNQWGNDLPNEKDPR